MRVSIPTRDAQEEPWTIWNAFIDVIGRRPKELDLTQIPAHLVFVYESEVQNGGHLQYFENQGTKALDVTAEALKILGAPCHRHILQEAAILYMAGERNPPETADDYVELALEGQFDEFDRRFHACEPSLVNRLEKHLEENLSLFLDIS